MNVIFLDIDGVICTLNSITKPLEPEDMEERRIKILSDICHKYNCKVVISSNLKESINIALDPTYPEELLIGLEKTIQLLELFKKYDIEVLGTTPFVEKNCYDLKNKFYKIVKEEEIKAYLDEHPEVEHFCVIDDDDLVYEKEKEIGDFSKSDLNMFRDYLIVPLQYSKTDPLESGLQESHIEEVGIILQKKRIY